MPTAAAQKPVLGLLRVLGHCQDTCAAPSRQGVGVPRTARDGKCWPGFISSFELLVWKRLELEWAAGVQHHRTIEWPRSEGILKITMFQSPATGRDPADTWPDGAEAGAAELSCELGLGLACGKTFYSPGGISAVTEHTAQAWMLWAMPLRAPCACGVLLARTRGHLPSHLPAQSGLNPTLCLGRTPSPGWDGGFRAHTGTARGCVCMGVGADPAIGK